MMGVRTLGKELDTASAQLDYQAALGKILIHLNPLCRYPWALPFAWVAGGPT